MTTKTFNVSKYKLTIPDPADPTEKKRVPLESFTLRETSGEDDIAAAERATVSGSKSAMSFRNDVIAEAFVAVNGDPVVTPYGWRTWPSKARDFVLLAFTKMNDAPAGELADFEKAAFGEPAPAPNERG
jgi:hypothetical protein